MAMPPPTGPTRNKLPMYLILAGAAGAGYYFYSSGAQRSATEHGAKEEAHKLASNVDQASASAQHALNKAGATIDSTVQEGKARINEGINSAQATKEATAKEVMSKVDAFDRKVETEASKAKGGIMSWFGKS